MTERQEDKKTERRKCRDIKIRKNKNRKRQKGEKSSKVWKTLWHISCSLTTASLLVWLHYTGCFLTVPPSFQYQNEKRWAANQRFCSMKFSMYNRSSLVDTWVLKTRLIEKKHPKILFRPNCQKLQDNSKNVNLKIRSKGLFEKSPFLTFPHGQ